MSGDQVIIQDSFDSYATATDLRSHYARAGSIALVAGRSGKAVRFSYTASTRYNLLERAIPAASDVFVSYWYRTSPGADPSNGGTNRWGMTMLRAERAGAGRWQASVAQRSLLFGIDDSSMPNVYQNVGTTPRFGTTNDGTWHQLTARLVGGASGYAMVWVDGTLVTDTRGLGYTHPSAGVTLLRFPGEVAAAPSAPFTIDIDDFVVWKSSGRPAPPDTATPPDTTTPPPAPAPVARIAVTPTTLSLSPGGSAQLTVALQDSTGNILVGRAVTWTSSAPAVATVSPTGAVQAVTEGSAVIMATSEGRSATVQVTVAPVPVASVGVTLNSPSMLVGNSTQAVATLRDANGNVLSGRSVTWQSSNPATATVNATGLVTAVAAGSADIVATSEGRSGRATVTVTAPPAPVASVTITPSSASLAPGGTLQLAATLRDAAGNVLTGRSVSWSSGSSSIATVSTSGLVTGVSGGTTTIRATSEGRTGTGTVTVTAPPPPPPTGTGEPTYDGTRHALVLRDNFDYASRAAMLAAYPTGRRTQYVDLTTGRGGTGGAARLRYGTPGGTYDIIFGPENRLTSVGGWNGTLPQKAGPYTHFVFSTWFRFSAGADPAATNSWGVKGFMFWHTGAGVQGGRYQNAINRGSADGRTRGPKGANPCNAQSGMNLYKTADGCAPLFSTLADGQWHRFTIEIYAGNDPSGLRGERYWVDGNLIYDDVGRNVGPTTAAGHYAYAYPVRHWMVFGNFITEGAMSPFFTFDVDEWTAWTNR